MVVFPNAKINLGLNILSKRPDGYHNISSCFYPIPLTDLLEIQVAKDFSFETSGITIPDAHDNNLCIKAYELLKTDFDLPPVRIYLHKIIPIGAGLGGGSADASFTLKCLNELFELQLATETLEKYAGQLGSDCPFFIENKPVLAEGTGNKFTPVAIDLKGKYLVLLYPNLHISTAQAYSGVNPKQPEVAVETSLSQPITTWTKTLINDFESSIFPQFPELANIKKELQQAGATYTSMSGSGSSIYGLFEEKTKLPDKLQQYAIWQGFL